MIDSRELRNACGRFATGITIVSTKLDGQNYGMTANGFMSVSLEPPLIVVSVAKKARMHGYLDQTMRYGISMLRHDMVAYSNHFAGRPDDSLEIPWFDQGGTPLIEGCLAHMTAKVVDAHEAGDHTLYIAEVEWMQYTDGAPLLYYYSGYEQMTQKNEE